MSKYIEGLLVHEEILDFQFSRKPEGVKLQVNTNMSQEELTQAQFETIYKHALAGIGDGLKECGFDNQALNSIPVEFNIKLISVSKKDFNEFYNSK